MRYLLAILLVLFPTFGTAQNKAAGDYLVPKNKDGHYLGNPIENFYNLDSRGTGMKAADSRQVIQSCYDYAWSRYNFDRVDRYGQTTQFRIIHLSNVHFKNNPFDGRTVRDYEYGGHPYLLMRISVQRRNANGQPLGNGLIKTADCVIDKNTFGRTNNVIGFEIK